MPSLFYYILLIPSMGKYFFSNHCTKLWWQSMRFRYVDPLWKLWLTVYLNGNMVIYSDYFYKVACYHQSDMGENGDGAIICFIIICQSSGVIIDSEHSPRAMFLREIFIDYFSQGSDNIRGGLLIHTNWLPSRQADKWRSHQLQESHLCSELHIIGEIMLNCGLRMRLERFPRKPLVTYPGMYHGTCVMHVGIVKQVLREKRSPHSRSMHIPLFYVSCMRPMDKKVYHLQHR